MPRCRLRGPRLRGPNVLAVQNALKSQGYDFGPLDGVYGPLTAAAVEMFKRWVGIEPVNSVVDLSLYYRLGVRGVRSPRETEQLAYNNALFTPVETAWYDGKKY